MWTVYINGEEAGTIDAPTYQAARKLARAIWRVSCDIIG